MLVWRVSWEGRLSRKKYIDSFLSLEFIGDVKLEEEYWRKEGWVVILVYDFFSWRKFSFFGISCI